MGREAGGGIYTFEHSAPDTPSLLMIGANPCRPALVTSTGFYPPEQVT
jgi:hypothetical protein